MTLYLQLSALKEAIDKESEHKCELMKLVSEISDVTRKKLLTQQMDKCEEKLESLMMMMVHYCAGLQHCLDTEEAQRRLQVVGVGAVGGDVRGGEGDGVVERDGPLQASGDSDNLDWYEDAGIQFIVTEDHYWMRSLLQRTIIECVHWNRGPLLNACMGAQWFSGRVLDSRPRSRRFGPHRHHCVVALEQDTIILA